MPNPRDFKTRAFFWQLWIGVPFLFYCIIFGTSACFENDYQDNFFPNFAITQHTTGPFMYCRTAGPNNDCFEYQKGCTGLQPTDAHFGSLSRCNLFNAWRGFLVIAVVFGGLSWVIAIHYTFYSVKTFPSPQVSVVLTLLQGVFGLIGFAIGESWRATYYGGTYRYAGIFSIVNWVMAFVGAPLYLKFGKDTIDTNYNVNN